MLRNNLGQRVGEIIITALWPLIWLIYVVVGLVIFIEAALVYLGWGFVVRIERLFKRTHTQAVG